MEGLTLLLGSGVLVFGFLGLLFAATVGVPLWETYWLHSLWAVVVMPLGVPAIGFWELFALNIFISALLFPASSSCAGGTKDEKQEAMWTRLLSAFVRPVVAYYVIRWAL